MIYYEPEIPALMAFNTPEGVKLGKPVRWINKLYRVVTSDGSGWLVMPAEILWAWL